MKRPRGGVGAYVLAAGQVQLAGSGVAILERPDIGDLFLGRITDPEPEPGPDWGTATRSGR